MPASAISIYKPKECNSVSPYLIVAGANNAIEFLIRVFGATEIRRFSNEAGGIAHSEVRIDDTVVMISDGVEGWPPIAAHIAFMSGIWMQLTNRRSMPGRNPFRNR